MKKTRKNTKSHPYMREHSKFIRCLLPSSDLSMEEDLIVSGLEPMTRAILVMTCRNRQRLLSQAWAKWIEMANVVHDYTVDIITILSRVIPEDELRTELEVEVFFKWVLQNHMKDPTGLAYTLYLCNSKKARVRAIQSARLDSYQPGEAILIQNDLPRHEEGHYTVLRGSCEIVIFHPDSLHLLDLQTAKKNKQYETLHHILDQGRLINTIGFPAGFGELSTLTKVKRSASVRASRNDSVELLVIPQPNLLDCLNHRKLIQVDSGTLRQTVPADVMEYLRQSGLIPKASVSDFMEFASNMTKRQFKRGTILYKKGKKAQSIYIVVSGEIFLDTSEYFEDDNQFGLPFQHLDPDKCFYLASGSILGDECLSSTTQTYESSAIVVTEIAVCFELKGFAIKYLKSRVGIEKYAALAYMNESVDSGPLNTIGNETLHSSFNSLRKAIATNNPYRGMTMKVHEEERKGNKSPPKLKLQKSTEFLKRKSSTVTSFSGAAASARHFITEFDACAGILPPAGMIRIQSVHKLLKKRNIQSMRDIAQEHILSVKRVLKTTKDAPRSLESTTKLLSSPSKSPTKRAVSPEQSLRTTKLEAAVSKYLERSNEQLRRNVVVVEDDGDNNIQIQSNPIKLLEEAALVDFDSEVTSAVSSIDTPSLSRHSTHGIIEVDTSLPKIEQYFIIIKEKRLIPHLDGRSTPGTPKSLASNLDGDYALRRAQLIKMRSQNSFDNKKEYSMRPSTMFTVGMDASTNQAMHRLKMQRYHNKEKEEDVLHPHQQSQLQHPVARLSFIEEEIIRQTSSGDTFDTHSSRRMRGHELQFLQELKQQDPVNSNNPTLRRQTSKANNWNTSRFVRQSSIEPPSILFNESAIVENLPPVKSPAEHIRMLPRSLSRSTSLPPDSTRPTNSQSLELTNSTTLAAATVSTTTAPTITETEPEVKPFSAADIEKRKSVFSQKSTSMSVIGAFGQAKKFISKLKSKSESTMSAHAEANKVDVLVSFKEIIEAPPKQCRYMNGKKNSTSISRFRLTKDENNLNSVILATKEKDKDLESWKEYCLQRAVVTQNGPKQSLPVLANSGSHRYYWEKTIITTEN